MTANAFQTAPSVIWTLFCLHLPKMTKPSNIIQTSRTWTPTLDHVNVRHVPCQNARKVTMASVPGLLERDYQPYQPRASTFVFPSHLIRTAPDRSCQRHDATGHLVWNLCNVWVGCSRVLFLDVNKRIIGRPLQYQCWNHFWLCHAAYW